MNVVIFSWTFLLGQQECLWAQNILCDIELGINVSLTHFLWFCTGKREIKITLQTCACMCALKFKLQSPECLIMIVINLIVYSTKSCKYLHCIQDDKLLPKALLKILNVLINLFLKSSKAGASSDWLRDSKFHKAVATWVKRQSFDPWNKQERLC